MAGRALGPVERARLRRSVGAYFAYQTFGAANFFWPVFFVYYQRHGRLDLPAIFALQAFHTLARVLLDVPLGVLADRYGRRLLLAASAAMTALGCAVLVSDASLAAFYAAELCFAIGVAAKSGADSAFLFDALAEHGRMEDYPRVEGRAQSLGALAGATGALASGFLFEWSATLPYLVTLTTACATLFAAILLDEPIRHSSAAAGVRGVARGALIEVVRSPAAVWLIGLYTLLIVLSHTVFYLQQPYFESVGIPVALFGVFVAAAKLVNAATARFAGAIERYVSPRRMPAFLLGAALSPIALMSVVASPVGAALVTLRGVADGLLQPVVHFYMHRLVSPARRASVLSIASFTSRLVQAAVLWGFGVALAHLSLGATLRLATASGVLAGMALLWVPRVARRAATPEPATVAQTARQTLGAGRDED